MISMNGRVLIVVLCAVVLVTILYSIGTIQVNVEFKKILDYPTASQEYNQQQTNIPFQSTVPAKPQEKIYVVPSQPNIFNKTVIWVVAAEGSGSTAIGNLLGAKLPNTTFVGQYWNSSHYLANFTKVTHDMWSHRSLPNIAHTPGRYIKELQRLFEIHNNKSTIVVHRSYPDWDLNHWPDVQDQFLSIHKQAEINVKIIVAYRDPREACHSNLRRKHRHVLFEGIPSITTSARLSDLFFTLVSQQMAALDPSQYHVVCYDCWRYQPEQTANNLLDYLQVHNASDREVVLNTMVHSAATFKYRDYKTSELLTDKEKEWLTNYFTPQRSKKWSTLTDACGKKCKPRDDLVSQSASADE